MVLLEVCIDSLEGLEAAVAGGAARLEVCSRLDLAGLTPTAELLTAAVASRIPCVAMIRPRAGDFAYDGDELRRMRDAVARSKDFGVCGFALGVLDGLHEVDRDALAALVESASPHPVTFHRAFDEASDRTAALEALVDVGVARVLTSGGARTAHEGRHALRETVRQARGRIVVVAAGGVRAHNAEEIVRASGVLELHSSTVFAPPRARSVE